jgi:uncharacterized protein YukE
MTSPGVTQVNPGELREAAALLDDASAQTELAGEQAAAAVADGNPFGPSGPARNLRNDWNKATTARATESAALAAAIASLADRLRDTADDYERTDGDNASKFRN